MTMPKKGRRSIVVEGNTYYYMIKKTYEHEYHGSKKASVTIESPDGKFYADPSQLVEITPAYVERLIRGHLIEKE